MKKACLILAALALWGALPCFAPFSAMAAQAPQAQVPQAPQAPPSANKPGAELVQTMLSLYRDKRPEVRMEALFASAGLAPYPELVEHLRAGLATAGAAERFILRYVLATMTRASEDIEAFLDAFPADACAVYEAMLMEYALRHREIADFLLTLAYENEVWRKKALPRLRTILVNLPDLYWGEYEMDPLRRRDNTLDESYELPGCEQDVKVPEEPTEAPAAPIAALLASKDDVTRLTALLMRNNVYGLRAGHEEAAAFADYGQRDMTPPERVFFAFCTHHDDRPNPHAVDAEAEKMAIMRYVPAFPDTPQAMEDVLGLEARTYRAPRRGLFDTLLYMAKDDFNDWEAARKLELALQYGKKYLSARQQQAGERTLQKVAYAKNSPVHCDIIPDVEALSHEISQLMRNRNFIQAFPLIDKGLEAIGNSYRDFYHEDYNTDEPLAFAEQLQKDHVLDYAAQVKESVLGTRLYWLQHKCK
jgi:hypothetical protein